MTFEEFAREILLADIRVNGISNEQQAKHAVRVAESFHRELNARELRINKYGEDLTEDEITRIKNRQVLLAIKSVRERLQIPLKDAKALVDRERHKLGI